MWIRKRLDLGWVDLLAGFLACAGRFDAAATAQRIEAGWGNAAGDWLACLSVRTGLDLVLRALAWPPGTEVLMSALTIPDMARIVRAHGLVPVPVDLDPRTMAPTIEAVERACTPRARALLVAHLFGSRTSLDPLVEFARQRQLLLLEDCAQAYEGSAYAGHPLSDVSMFSFGTIKTATALGGAVLRMADPRLARKVRALHAEYPVQPRLAFLRRLLKYALLKGLSGRVAAGLLFAVCRLAGLNADHMLNRMVRGFAGDHFWSRLRHRPGAALLALLERRLNQNHAPRLARRKALGERLAWRLSGLLTIPADQADWHGYWVFPVLLDEPPRAIDCLARHGFDLTQGESMHVVPPPGDRPDRRAVVAEGLLARMVYLPCYADLTETAVDCLADALRAHLGAPDARTGAASGQPQVAAGRMQGFS